MVQRFSTREEARQHAIAQKREEVAAYWPRGCRYNEFPEVYRLMNRPAATWTYRSPDAPQGTMVVMHTPSKTSKEYTVLAKYKDYWYCDFPEPPYLLYQRYEWIDAETVYICEGERTSDAIQVARSFSRTSSSAVGVPSLFQPPSRWTTGRSGGAVQCPSTHPDQCRLRACQPLRAGSGQVGRRAALRLLSLFS